LWDVLQAFTLGVADGPEALCVSAVRERPVADCGVDERQVASRRLREWMRSARTCSGPSIRHDAPARTSGRHR